MQHGTASGRITGLIGPNGAGKSTLYKLILGLISADSGTMKIFGKEGLLNEEDKQRIGVVMAESGFSGYLCIKDVRRILRSMYPKFDEADFNKKISEAGFSETKKIKEFSTGMKVKLKVIAALCHNADLLILDEPTAGLDVLARDEILDYLRAYMEENENRSVLISSHISADLESICDDLYMINKGEIILHEDTDRLLSSYAILKVDEDAYERIDKRYVIKERKTGYGYDLFTGEKKFYAENYPGIIIENGSIDELITMMIKGENA